MNPKQFKGALLHRRNIIALIAAYLILNTIASKYLMAPLFQSIVGSNIYNVTGEINQSLYNSARQLLIYGGALATYGAFVTQSLLSKQFRTDFGNKEVVSEIKKLSEECHVGVRNLKKKLDLGAHQRISGVLAESDEIVQSFLNGDKTPLKVRVVQQSLKLTSNYIKLADMFRARAFASDGEKIRALARRINANTGNLKTIKDQGIYEELRRVIEADEKMIESLKNERLELERIDARLQYMETTIGMLKYNIISNLESEDTLASLESDVQEASALNSVLNERYDERREDRRIRF